VEENLKTPGTPIPYAQSENDIGPLDLVASLRTLESFKLVVALLVYPTSVLMSAMLV
jgi:hypothetical protein